MMRTNTTNAKLQRFWRICSGTTFLLLLFYTALNASLIYIPPLSLLFLFRFPLARWLTDTMIGTWLGFAPALYEVIYGVKIKATGDVSKLSKIASSLVLLNHRTRLDWLFILSLQARYASLRRFKISLKYPLRHVLGAGWAMQTAGFLFLKRTFEEDRTRIEDLLNHYKKWNCVPQLLLFPEGTDFRQDSHESSKKYARKNNLPEYEYVLHPRTTGFVSIWKFMKETNNLNQVVDVTVGYPENIVQKEDDLLTQELPREIIFDVKVFETSEMPDDSSELSGWLQERWLKKEEFLKNSYEQNNWVNEGNDLNYDQKLEIERDTTLYFVLTLFYWLLLSGVSSYLFIYFSVVRWYYLFSFSFCVTLGHFIGIDNIGIQLDKR